MGTAEGGNWWLAGVHCKAVADESPLGNAVKKGCSRSFPGSACEKNPNTDARFVFSGNARHDRRSSECRDASRSG
eukprot:gene7139-biopygen7109